MFVPAFIPGFLVDLHLVLTLLVFHDHAEFQAVEKMKHGFMCFLTIVQFRFLLMKKHHTKSMKIFFFNAGGIMGQNLAHQKLRHLDNGKTLFAFVVPDKILYLASGDRLWFFQVKQQGEPGY